MFALDVVVAHDSPYHPHCISHTSLPAHTHTHPYKHRLSALLSALDIVFASVAPLWVDNIRQLQGPPAHRGYRMYLHRTPDKQGGKVSGKGQGAKGRRNMHTHNSRPGLHTQCCFSLRFSFFCVAPFYLQKSASVVPAGPSYTLSYWCFIPGE